ncbi:MAG TPA: CPBP family glutamic-type intramembrane protease [Candidatus Paceibacterota bacterium]|nr:CPBP family glutamic-type intramembrane protease [Candidatus Paceibacterota bacterium]
MAPMRWLRHRTDPFVEDFTHWLYRGAHGVDAFIWLFVGLLVSVLWGGCVSAAIDMLDLRRLEFHPEVALLVLTPFAFKSVFSMALFEEFLFRTPLGLAARHIGSRELLKLTTFVSFAFGAAHSIGTTETLTAAAFVQGGLGVIYAFVFLKMGGMEGRLARGLAASTFVHFTYNVIVGSCMYR